MLIAQGYDVRKLRWLIVFFVPLYLFKRGSMLGMTPANA